MEDENIVRKICKNIYDQLGYGLSENAYQKALYHDLLDYYSDVQKEYHVNQYYTTSLTNKQIQISNLRIDILIDHRIIIELKSINKINNKDILQIKRYKKLLKSDKAYIINFSNNETEFIVI